MLHILDELELGRVPEDDGTAGESLPIPVRRIRHEGDADEPLPEIPPAPETAKRPRRRNVPAREPGPRSAGRAANPGTGRGRRPK